MKEFEEEMEDEAFMPTANQYRSMLHMLSQSKEVERGANWERSVEVLREAQALDLRLTEVSFNTGAVVDPFLVILLYSNCDWW